MKRSHSKISSDFLDDTIEIKQELEDGENVVNFNKVFLNSRTEFEETNFIKEENQSGDESDEAPLKDAYIPTEQNMESLSALDDEHRRNLKTFNFLKYILIKKQLKIKELIEQIKTASLQK